MLRARLRGGILNKARRGELKVLLPIGFVYSPDDKVILNPDQQIRQALNLLFQTFRQTGSAWATVKAFREQGLLFPQRLRSGPRKGEVIWGPLLHSRVLRTLRNPIYAGAYCFGRTRARKTVDGRVIVSRLPQDEWHALIPNAHEGYISWTEYEENLCHLRENAQAYGQERRKSPPREGPALLQGLVVCGLCGDRMTVRYHSRGDRLIPEYICQTKGIEHGAPICQHILGADLDEAIGKLLLEAVTPMTMEVSIAVQHELNSRTDEADRLHRFHSFVSEISHLVRTSLTPKSSFEIDNNLLEVIRIEPKFHGFTHQCFVHFIKITVNLHRCERTYVTVFSPKKRFMNGLRIEMSTF